MRPGKGTGKLIAKRIHEAHNSRLYVPSATYCKCKLRGLGNVKRERSPGQFMSKMSFRAMTAKDEGYRKGKKNSGMKRAVRCDTALCDIVEADLKSPFGYILLTNHV
jgi:hypothetical protein